MKSCDRPQVAMIVPGFPGPDNPVAGIFNLRTAQSLRDQCNLTVIVVRSWKPGRRLLSHTVYQGIPVVTAAVPQVPGTHMVQFITNVVLARWFGWRLLHSFLRGSDIVHSVDAASIGVPASQWACRAGACHLVQAVGSDVNVFLRAAGRSPLIAGWHAHVDAVVCNSRALSREFKQQYPGIARIEVVYRGVDLDRFCPEGILAGPFALWAPVRFLFLGGFPNYKAAPYGNNTKGGRLVLQCWQEIEQEAVSAGASLLIAGPESNSNAVRRWRDGLRYPNHVYLAGMLLPEDVPSFMRSADVVLVPSMQEGLPNAAVEASSCARAVLGSNVGGIPEVVEDGATGFLLQPGDVEAWRSALLQCLGRHELLKQLGNKARNRMKAIFDRRTYGDQMLEIYRSMLRYSVQKNRVVSELMPGKPVWNPEKSQIRDISHE